MEDRRTPGSLVENECRIALEREVQDLRQRVAALEGELAVCRGQVGKGHEPAPEAMSSVAQYRELIEKPFSAKGLARRVREILDRD